MQFTTAESSIMMMAGDHLSRFASHMYIEDITEWQIAGVRFSLVYPYLRANQNQLCTVLCKAREIYPKQSSKYAVFNKLDMDNIGWLRDLLAQYKPLYQREGFGSWRSRKHEEVLASFAACVNPASQPYVVNREYLRMLVSAFHAQARSAKEQVAIDGLADIAGMSAAQRKAAGAGKCYRCAAPKRRKTACTVCGYVPSSIE